MIHGVHLTNFANHRDTRLFFRRLAALVGENGAGKTTTMRAVQEATKLMQLKQTTDELTHEPPIASIRSELLRIGAKDMAVGLSGPGMRKGQAGQWGLAAKTSVMRHVLIVRDLDSQPRRRVGLEKIGHESRVIRAKSEWLERVGSEYYTKNRPLRRPDDQKNGGVPQIGRLNIFFRTHAS